MRVVLGPGKIFHCALKTICARQAKNQTLTPVLRSLKMLQRTACLGGVHGGMEELTDGELLTRIAAGEVAAFEVLYDRYARLVFSLCLRLLGDRTAAEEVAQDAFLRIWRHAGDFDPLRGTARSWLLTITHRLAIDHRRQRRGYAVPGSPEVEAAAAVVTDDPGERAVAGALGQQVNRALQGLAPEQRQVLCLVYFGGFTQSEVAQLLAVPLGTVKSRVRLALVNLRRLVGEG